MSGVETQPVRTRKAALIVLPVISGFLLFLSTLSFWTSWLVWIALMPLGLLIYLPGSRLWLYLGAYLGGLAYFLPGVQWLRYCDPSAWLGWLLLSAYLAIYFPAFVLLARIWHRRWKMPVLLAMPIAWVAMEYVRMHLMTGMGWLLLAHSIHEWTWVLQIADFSGVFGVSFFIALINAGILEALEAMIVPDSHSGQRVKFAVIMAVAVLTYGSLRSWQTETVDGPRVVLVQTSIPQSLKNNDPQNAFEEVLSLTADIRHLQADLVIWPETSYPYMYGHVDPQLSDREIDRLRLLADGASTDQEPSAEKGEKTRKNLLEGQRHLTAVTDELGMPLLVGTVRQDYQPGHAKVYNSSVLFIPEKGPVAYYDKIHLVPFGEYLPLKETLPILRRLMPYDEDTKFGLDHAEEFKSFHYDDLHFASLICFEDTLPHLARQFLVHNTEKHPIEFFVNQSNDGWFGGSIEARYHLAASIFRCIENRLPMVRVSNTGITALVDSYGTARKVFEKEGRRTNIRGGMDAVIPIDSRTAPYTTLGDWLPQLALAICVLGMFLSVARHLHRLKLGHRPPTV